METALFGVFDFVAKNKWIQYVLIALAAFFTLGLYLIWRDNGVRQRERQRAELETIKVVHEIEKESVNDADEAIAARESAPRAGSIDELSKLPDRIFRD